jgi:hypothetical protein
MKTTNYPIGCPDEHDDVLGSLFEEREEDVPGDGEQEPVEGLKLRQRANAISWLNDDEKSNDDEKIHFTAS